MLKALLAQTAMLVRKVLFTPVETAPTTAAPLLVGSLGVFILRTPAVKSTMTSPSALALIALEFGARSPIIPLVEIRRDPALRYLHSL